VTHTGADQTGTAGDDIFDLSPSITANISGYDVSGHDVFGVVTGAGGFQLVGTETVGSDLTMVDASASWNNIQGDQVIRWIGGAGFVDSAQKVDFLLHAMPGNQGGGRLVIGYTADHTHLALYYDADPANIGGATEVAVITNLTDPHSLGAGDFLFV